MSNRPSSPADQPTGPADFAQQTPEYGDGREIYQLVLHDVITRSEFGTKKYGHALRDTTDIDWIVNLYQELLDAIVYLRAEISQRVKASDGDSGEHLVPRHAALKDVNTVACAACGAAEMHWNPQHRRSR
jgi:hypothetical protein